METAVGAHLVATRDPGAEIPYWRDRTKVKSGRRRDACPGEQALTPEVTPGLHRGFR